LRQRGGQSVRMAGRKKSNTAAKPKKSKKSISGKRRTN
jgi:hypothetical protein